MAGCSQCTITRTAGGFATYALCPACAVECATAIEIATGEPLICGRPAIFALRQYLQSEFYTTELQRAVLVKKIAQVGAAMYLAGQAAERVRQGAPTA